MMKIAMIVSCDLFTKMNYGGKQCAESHIKLLCELYGEKNVHVFSFSYNPPKHNKSNMTTYPVPKGNLAAAFLSLQLRRVVTRKQEKRLLTDVRRFAPDLIWLDSSVLGRLTSKLKQWPVIAFFHNIEQLYSKNRVCQKGIQYLPAYWAATYNEKMAIKNARACICLNERDSKLLKSTYNRKADACLPIVFEDTFSEAKKKEINPKRHQLLFVGSNFPPNAHGIMWFVENVMPQLPDYKLLIVGRNFEQLREALTRDNVEVIGGVEDVSTYYYAAGALVMPILYGDGMKVKTAEAMLYGKVIFASPEALVGYEVNDIQGVYMCNDANTYVQCITNADKQGLLGQYMPEVRRHFLLNFELSTKRDVLMHTIEKVETSEKDNMTLFEDN